MQIDDSWPIMVACRGDVAAATVTWRRQGQLYATVVARATLRIRAGTLTIAPARPFGADRERMTLSELAPLLPRCDVVMLAAPKGNEVRLALRRGREMLLDKRVPAGERLFRVGASAPSSRHALDVPDTYDFNTLQVAPADQRVDYLQGGEHIVIGGVDGAGELLLPRFRPRLRLATASATSSLHCHLDTLAIDCQQGFVTLLFRGHVAIAESTLPSTRAEVVLDPLGVSAVVEEPELGNLFATMPLRRDAPRRAVDRTVPSDPHARGSVPVVPFSGSGPAPAPLSESDPSLAGGTMLAVDRMNEPSTPFFESKPAAAVATRLDALERRLEQKRVDQQEQERQAQAARERALRVEQERATAEAELRRHEEAARFAAEQRALEQREAARRTEEQTKRREQAKTLRSNLYDFKKHK